MVHGGAPAGWLDFSANPNPLGTPEAIRAAIAGARYERYADLETRRAERHLARDAGVAASAVLLTSGATDALRLIATAFVRPHGRVVIAGPTYGEYRRVARGAGQNVAEIRAEAPAFAPPMRHLIAALEEDGGAVCFVCDPNNPTGRTIGLRGLADLVVALGRGPSSLLVIDQSFQPFSITPSPDTVLLATGRVLLVRSLTKLLAIPGVRVGYVLAAPALIRRLRAARDPWSVGSHGIAAASVAHWALPEVDRDTVRGWRRDLVTGLAARGFATVRSDAPFVLAAAREPVDPLVTALARRRIAVRHAGSFGLPEHVRIAVRPPAEQARLFSALDDIAAARRGAPR